MTAPQQVNLNVAGGAGEVMTPLSPQGSLELEVPPHQRRVSGPEPNDQDLIPPTEWWERETFATGDEAVVAGGVAVVSRTRPSSQPRFYGRLAGAVANPARRLRQPVPGRSVGELVPRHTAVGGDVPEVHITRAFGPEPGSGIPDPSVRGLQRASAASSVRVSR
eukprot:TRINITY_DN5204_c0_g1_i11.p2 TRINITY_DN5204_c0_g1~~TRINITY_DN5204_c0_g1_i11.p2  ORF type:complete len:164 (+),score=18.98 TRINITY_DN5204_c0_g1_i11:192-683(+)